MQHAAPSIEPLPPQGTLESHAVSLPEGFHVPESPAYASGHNVAPARTSQDSPYNPGLYTALQTQAILLQHTNARLSEEIAKRQEVEATLQDSLERYRALIEGSIQGISIVNKQGRRVFANQRMVTLFGYASLEECLQADPLLTVAPQARSQIRKQREALLRGEESSAHYIYEGRRIDGTPLWIERVVTCITWEGEPALLSTVLDVTNQKRLEELQRAKEAAEAASQAKSSFLANISHELRTPLHEILSFADLGLEHFETLPFAKIRSYLAYILKSGHNLLQMLNELLDLAKLEAGKMSFAFEVVDFTTFLTTLDEEFHAQLAQRQLALQVHTTEEALFVLLDRQRMQQLLRNILRNAITFSPHGGLISVHLRRQENTLELTISDAGPGIPPAELEVIFSPFMQSSATSTGAGGTGLGLAICREIITAHHGRLWATNRPQGGAMFTISLPLHVSHHEDGLPVRLPIMAAQKQQRQPLVQDHPFRVRRPTHASATDHSDC